MIYHGDWIHKLETAGGLIGVLVCNDDKACVQKDCMFNTNNNNNKTIIRLGAKMKKVAQIMMCVIVIACF